MCGVGDVLLAAVAVRVDDADMVGGLAATIEHPKRNAPTDRRPRRRESWDPRSLDRCCSSWGVLPALGS
jgi:hypothetical protein